jgi:hypothetical protein
MGDGLSSDVIGRADVPPIPNTQAPPVQAADAASAISPRDMGGERQFRLGVTVSAAGGYLAPYLADPLSRRSDVRILGMKQGNETRCLG